MTRRQTNAAALLIGLSPLLYVVPGAQAKALGGAAWLGCVVALPVLLGLGAALKKRPPRTPGRWLSLALALWLTVSAAGVLHGCAERYGTAVGVFRTNAPYAALLLAVAVPAALSGKKALFRASEIFLPVVLALLALALLSALRLVRPARLIDLTQLSLGGALRAAFSVFAIGCAALVLPRVYAGAQPGTAPGAWLAVFGAVLCAVTVGMLGAPMTARLELPVFTMLRNTSLLHTVERLDALAAAVWVLPDVTALALLLRAGGDCAARAANKAPGTPWALGVAISAAAGALAIAHGGTRAPTIIALILALGAIAAALTAAVTKKEA